MQLNHITAGRSRKLLFLAQLPPPYHGQSAMASCMYDVFRGEAGLEVTHMWRGGARDNQDIGHRRLAKYLALTRLVLELAAMWLVGRRFDFAYLGIAPWAHTSTRDALLTWLAGAMSRRVFLHVHGDGLSALIEGNDMKARLIRTCLSDSELLAITNETARTAAASRVFARVIALPNMGADPGDPRVGTSRPITVGCLGNLDPRKGVLDFIEVIRELLRRGVDVQAKVVGGPTPALSVEALRDHVAALGLSDRITVTGRVSEEDKSTILSGQDVFLYPSRHDLAPVALIEALAHANAPIVIDIGGLREMVGPQLSGNVIPAGLSRDAMISRAADVIAAYAESEQRLEQDRGHARARYLNSYHPGTFRARVVALVNAAGEPGAAPAGKRLAGDCSEA